MPDTTPFGFLNVDKPLGLSSHAVVAQVRRRLKVKKVGHAGTLDPLATGVLVLCLGPATRLSEYAMSTQKRYLARVRLGEETTTYDAEGEIVQRHDVAHITQADVEAILPQFIGDIQQLPPLYSAIKKDGRKLYEIARAGETVEREARPVTIHSLKIVDWSSPEFGLDVVCGSGTYIRSLAHDIGAALHVGAHLSGLARTQSGVFDLADAVALDALLDNPNWQAHLLPPDYTLQHLTAFNLDETAAADVRHGRTISLERFADGAPITEFVRAYAPDGRLLALLRPVDANDDDMMAGLWRPHKVFSSRKLQ